jgi:hypothetical protein
MTDFCGDAKRPFLPVPLLGPVPRQDRRCLVRQHLELKSLMERRFTQIINNPVFFDLA